MARKSAGPELGGIIRNFRALPSRAGSCAGRALESTAPPRYNHRMPRSKEQLLKIVIDGGVIAVIRAPSAEILVPIAEALLAGGIPAVEVTMSTPKAIHGIELLADRFGDRAVVGV